MSKRTDISQQIRKYLNGELDARAMQQLEKEALNDPFLAEALEGYEQTGTDQQKNLSDIDKRLQERIREKNRRVILWRTISIAASIVVLLTIGGLWLYNRPSTFKPKLIVQVDKHVPPIIKSAPPVDTALLSKKTTVLANNKKHTHSTTENINSQPAVVADQIVAPASPEGNALEKDSPLIADNSLGDVVVKGYGTQKKKDLTGSVATISSKDLNQSAVTDISTGLQGKVAGLQVNIANDKQTGVLKRTIVGTVTDKADSTPMAGVTVKIRGTDIATQTNSAGKFRLKVPDNAVLEFSYVGFESVRMPVNNNARLAVRLSTGSTQLNEVAVTAALGVKTQSRSLGYSTATISSKETTHGTITGIVTDKADGTPLPGVTIKVKGTNKITQTNSTGNFSLSSVQDSSILVFNYIGYSTVEIKIHKRDHIAVSMMPSANSLAEVVVTGPVETYSESAHPAEGWSVYRKYIKENAVSPDGQTGVVKLSFIVNPDKSLSDFKIIKSVSAKTDSAAIDLVNNGPAWFSNTNSKPEKVKLRIKFKGK